MFYFITHYSLCLGVLGLKDFELGETSQVAKRAAEHSECKVTTAAKANVDNFEAVKAQFLLDIKIAINFEDTPELVINRH